VPGEELATLVPVVGLGLLVFNDAVLKQQWPGLVSGKLSDFAVVLFFPFLLTASTAVASGAARAVARLVLRRPVRTDPGLTRARLIVGLAVTAFALSAVNLSHRARDLYLRLLDLIDVFDLQPRLGYVVDASDLIGLTMVPVAWWWGNRVIRANDRRTVRVNLASTPGTPT
jgi:hypothetical protein